MARPGYEGCREPGRQKKSKLLGALELPKRTPAAMTAGWDGDSMAMRRSTQMLMLGLAVFAIGAGVVLVSFMGSGDGKDKTAASTTTTTVQAGTVVVNAATPAAP